MAICLWLLPSVAGSIDRAARAQSEGALPLHLRGRGGLHPALRRSAIVVNKPNIDTGKMERDALRGFIAAARELDYAITDEQTFLREQQGRVFAWALAEAYS